MHDPIGMLDEQSDSSGEKFRMTDKTRVDVCMLTYMRPNLLPLTLESIARLDLSGIEIRVIVIDNDSAASGQDIVKNFSRTSDFPVVYDVEPIQNIARARNRALDHAKADLLAFIDDDEIASPGWLKSLLNTRTRYQADVVFGPVRTILPDNAPAWAKNHPAFNRPKRQSGAIVDFGGAGNVLVDCRELKRYGVRFDETFGRSGGEDSDFFYRLTQAGGKAVWCAEADVSEFVESDRLRKQWVLRRSYFGGLTFARVVVKRKSYSFQLAWGVSKFMQLVSCALVLLPVRLVSYPKYMFLLSKLHAARGHLSAICAPSKIPPQY